MPTRLAGESRESSAENRAADGAERPHDANGGVLVIPDDAVIIVAMRNVVLFPGMILPLTIGRPQSLAAAQQAVKSERPIGILLQRDSDVQVPGPDDLCRTGTLANILRYVTLPDDSHVIVCQGQGFRTRAAYSPTA